MDACIYLIYTYAHVYIYKMCLTDLTKISFKIYILIILLTKKLLKKKRAWI